MGDGTRASGPPTFLRKDPQEWVRGPASYDPRGWIVLKRSDAVPDRPVSPAIMGQLPFDLAAIEHPDAACKFVERYGLLRQGHATAEGKALGDEYRERWSEWKQEVSHLREVMAIWAALQLAEPDDARLLRAYFAHYNPGDAAAHATDYEVSQWVSEAVGLFVTEQLRDIEILLSPDLRYRDGQAGSFRLAVQAATPLAHAYYELGHLFGERVPIPACRNPRCGRYFAQTDPRQKYCSPQCNAAHRKQRERERKRGEPDGNPDGNGVSSNADW
jgi:hypothetical protein